MSDLRGYTIAYKGVSDGSHHYSFDVGDSFFAAFGEGDIKGGVLGVEVEFTKKGSLIVLSVEIQGDVTVECDRCLDELSFPIDYRGEFTVKVGEVEDIDLDEDVMWLPSGEDMIPLVQYIYDSIYLSLPYQRVHADDSQGCDPDMLGRFGIVTGQEFDEMSVMQGRQADTQWAGLEQLKKELEDEEENI